MKKKKSLLCLTILSLIVASFSAFINIKEDTISAIGNYTTDVSSYYSSINFSTKGKQLLGSLHDLITSTHKYYTAYDDIGPNGYQKNTDQWYTSGNNKSSGYIREFYSGKKWDNTWDAVSGHYPGGYTREHVWCVNNSGGLWEKTGAGADMHHLRPAEFRINSTRSDSKFGNVSNTEANKNEDFNYASNLHLSVYL